VGSKGSKCSSYLRLCTDCVSFHSLHLLAPTATALRRTASKAYWVLGESVNRAQFDPAGDSKPRLASVVASMMRGSLKLRTKGGGRNTSEGLQMMSVSEELGTRSASTDVATGNPMVSEV
jgi:hypothetical protein